MELNTIEIHEPRWHDNKVLIKDTNVSTHNKVIFTKANSLKGSQYYISGQVCRSYPKEQIPRKHGGGTFTVYAVDMDALEKIATPENERQRKIV